MNPLDRIKRIRASSLPSSYKLVLYDLAGRANSKDECWPAQATLAKDTGLSIRTIRDVLHALRTIQVLTITPRTGIQAILRLKLGSLTPATTAAPPGNHCRLRLPKKIHSRPTCPACGVNPSPTGEPDSKCFACRKADALSG